MDWCYGNGALGASILDLSRLDTGLYTERLLRFSTLSFLTQAPPLSDGKPNDYAMGWFTSMQRGTRSINHSGRFGGWGSYFVRYPEYGATVIVLANNRDVPLGEFAADLAGTVVPQLSLSPIFDEYPNLTANHRAFLQSIVEGRVDPGRLAGNLRTDYEAKDHWSGIAATFTNDGGVFRFEPVSRRQLGPNAYQSVYRVEGTNGVQKLELTWNGAGEIIGLMVRS